MKKRNGRSNIDELESKFKKELEEYRLKCEAGEDGVQEYPVDEENDDLLGGHYLEDL